MASDKLHPILLFNYPMRVLGNLVNLMLAWRILAEQLWQPSYIWIVFFCLFWPHVGRYLLPRWLPSRSAEYINLRIDAGFFGLLTATMFAPIIITGLLAATLANSLVSGGPRLLLTSIPLYGAGLLLGYWQLSAGELLVLDRRTELLAAITILAYFCVFAYSAYRTAKGLIEAKRAIEEMSHTDVLTRCRNRRFLDRFLPVELQRSRRMRYPICVIFADLDHFKAVNDSYGHAAGDQILQAFAEIAQSQLRVDVDWLARYGGEEFVAVLPGCDLDYATDVAERIRRTLQQHSVMLDEQIVRVSCSFGVAGIDPISQPQVSLERLLGAADAALYRAKQSGRNRVEQAGPNALLS